MELTVRRGAPYEYRHEADRLDLFSVSQGRKEAFDPFAGVDPAILKAAGERGTILHRRFFFALASCAGHCAYPKRIESLGGYCDSMDRWIDEAKPKPVQLEAMSLNRRHRYAGQIDGQILYLGRDLTIMDLKTGEETPTDPMQLAAYDEMEGFKSERHLDVYLDKSGGRAREKWVTKEKAIHLAGFLNALSLLRWRMK